MPPKKKPTWANSEAKALLRADLLSGVITSSMTYTQIFDLNPVEHKKWVFVNGTKDPKKWTNWCSNVRNLRDAIRRDKDRMVKDVLSYHHDLLIIKDNRSPHKIHWHLSDAPALLKQDVDEGKHKLLKPEHLHKSRAVYRQFELEEFRKHIYQEVDKRPKRAIRFEKKKKSWLYPELNQGNPRLRGDES